MASQPHANVWPPSPSPVQAASDVLLRALVPDRVQFASLVPHRYQGWRLKAPWVASQLDAASVG